MSNKIEPEKFRVRENKALHLKDWPSRIEPLQPSKESYKEAHAKYLDELQSLQNVLYAHNRYALLLIFQAMDAAGKDSAIKHVMSGVNPQGCQVYSFKHPSVQELDHDFLWRTTACLPERGRIGIFNRSYYEEVLIVRVHPEILEAENLPEELVDKKIWKHRYDSIRNLEEHLERNGTVILKFFLHISKEEQRKRFLKRLDDPEKNWKFNIGDIEERKHWNSYIEAYEECLRATSTEKAPWYVVPADNKPDARLIISRVIINKMKSLKMTYPRPSKAHLEELETIRRLLEKEK
jgi:PPK2 family polyphosphate:nucleotide phosphotransferase